MNRILLFLLISCHLSYGQERVISGMLQSSKGGIVSFASVMVKNAEDQVIVFKSSDEKGSFSMVLPVNVTQSELYLEINHLGFKKVRKSMEAGERYYEILMEEQAINLADVEVKSRPRIIRAGDTLRYDVGAFAENEDRSIGDVLKRLPGIQVSDNGQVKFNGKSISNLYIDGDDLLDDKYAIGTKTIPLAMVKGVEVLQNHQPIKVLKNKVLSDQVALNLVIKEEAKLKLTGQVKIGAGLPQQFNSEINTVLFNKKYKVLNVLKGNNVGDDLSSDFTGFDQASMLSSMGNSHPSTLLSIGTAGQPSLPKRRYFFNRSGALNANNLINLSSGLQLKSNVGLLWDKNEMHYASNSAYYTEQDTIRYNENQHVVNRPFITDISLTGNINKDHYYFNNSLKFTYSAESSQASLRDGAAGIRQRLTNKVRNFSNTLAYVPELKNGNIIRINWYLNHYQKRQMLQVHPGLNADVFNQGHPFDGLYQGVETPVWFNKASLAYQLTKGSIKQHYEGGIVNELQQLNSRLQLRQLDGAMGEYQGSADNALHWNRHQAFVLGRYEYDKGGFQSVLSIPLTLQRINYTDRGFDLNEYKRQVLINPSFQLKYLTGVEDYLSLKYHYQNQTGEMTSVYPGAVLTNYRSLQANDAVLNEKDSHTLRVQYNFRRSLSMLFMHAGMTYNRASANTIASNRISGAISQTVLLSMVNNVNSMQADAGISKYIFALGATADLNASWSNTRFNQLFNGELLPFNNGSFQLSPSVEARLWSQVVMHYRGNAVWMTSKLDSSENQPKLADQQVFNLEQSIDLSFSPIRHFFLRVSGKHQYGKQPQSQDIKSFFVDANARYRINPWRMDIELDFSNLANVKRYESYHLSANQFLHNQYQLRGRMMLLKVVFTL